MLNTALKPPESLPVFTNVVSANTGVENIAATAATFTKLFIIFYFPFVDDNLLYRLLSL
jgi:hypothetical protein